MILFCNTQSPSSKYPFRVCVHHVSLTEIIHSLTHRTRSNNDANTFIRYIHIMLKVPHKLKAYFQIVKGQAFLLRSGKVIRFTLGVFQLIRLT